MTTEITKVAKELLKENNNENTARKCLINQKNTVEVSQRGSESQLLLLLFFKFESTWSLRLWYSTRHVTGFN